MANRIEALSPWEIAESGKSTAELRRQYSKQAYTARQRLEKIRQAFGSKAEVVQRREGDFKTLRELGSLNRVQLAQEISNVQRFLESGSSRVREYGKIRQNIVETFQRSGYEFVNESNLDDLYQFLEDARSRNLASMYGSDQLVETWNRAQKRGLTSEQLMGNIEYWAANPDKSTRLYASRYTSREDFLKNSEKWN
jgi:ribosomal protein L32E